MIIIKGGRWGVEVGRKECFCRVRGCNSSEKRREKRGEKDSENVESK